MALTTEQIDAEAFARWGEMKGAPLAMCRGFARAIESEVRKQDTELIRQLRNALESVDDVMPFPVARQVLKVAHARLGDTP